MTTPRPRQWDAIRNVDRHTLVAAGAGTGKTTTVVNRILYLLGAEVNGQTIAEPVSLQRIAAITYTNAAAADLKRKLRDALREAGLRDAAYEVDLARIGTIHGFCGDILREFALRAGRDPSARILREDESAALVDEVVRDTVLGVLEDRSVAGLDDLFATYGVSDVEHWIARLASDSDRLLRIAENDAPRNVAEQAVVSLAERALVRLSDVLQQQGALDFDRMIVWTRDLLARHSSVTKALQRRLHTLIVDEFQDVDPVQREIAYLIGDPHSRRDDTTRLMLVGDPKQSIFRFRRADVTVWSGVERDFKAGLGTMVTLEDNFRSVAPILAMVDATVGRILDTPLDGDQHREFEVRFSPVRTTRAPVEGPAVELVYVPDDTLGADERRKAEARDVAERISALRKDGVECGQIAVLLTSWSDLEIYEKAIRVAGHATYAFRAEGFYECREVLDLVLALEVIRDPRDDRALFGWLRSPFVGVKDETLLAIALAGSAPHWDHLTSVATPERELLDDASALLHELIALRDRVPTADLLAILLERTGYIGHLALQGEDGRQAIANIRKLLQMARQAPEQGVGELLRLIGDARAGNVKEGSARLYGEGDDVVTITSVHSAKGLEWRVVFWCDLARGPRKDSSCLLVGRDALALKDPDADTQSAQWTALEQAEEQECAAELKRLWYVAATRAKDLLVLTGFCGSTRAKGCAGHTIWAELGHTALVHGARVAYRGHDGSDFEAVLRLAEPVGEAPDTEVPAGEAALWDAPAPVVVADGRSRHSATELMAYARCERRHWLKYIGGLREPQVRDARGGKATVRGQIVHDVLEHLGDDDVDVLLETAIGRWDSDAPTPDGSGGLAYRRRLREDIDAVAGNADYQALAELSGARREVTFLHMAGDGVVLEGAVDLAAHAPEGLVLLDVKTHAGTHDMTEVVARYELQRDAYISAVESISGEPVVRFAFQFPEAGQISVPVTDEMRAAGRARIAELVARMGHDAGSMTAHPDECAWCGYRTVGWCAGVQPAAAATES